MDSLPRVPMQPISSLHTLRQELDQSLLRARQAVEQYVEEPDDRSPLEQAALELHQIQGSASVIQYFGVAALAEEMKQASLALLQQERVVNRDALQDALTGALIQLADYIDALAIGFDDCALVLQPLINELRLAIGRPVLTEEELFAAQMATLNPLLSRGPMIPEGSEAQQLARRLVPGYETALLQWFKGSAPAQNQARIGKIAEQLADAALSPVVQRLCRALAACSEALLTHGLAESLALKRLLGRVGMQLKLLAFMGEQALSTQSDLLPSLLFFIGRSQGRGHRVAAIRQEYALDVYLPSPEALDQLRRRLRGPNTQLLNRVSSEIRSDLAQVKDAVDLAVRVGGQSIADLKGTRDRLVRVAKTLAVLGLAPLQRMAAQQAEVLERLDLADDARPGATDWMDFATSVLHVEENLDDALFRQLHRRGTETLDLEPRSEYANGVGALMRESLVNFAKIKALVDGHLKSGDPSLFSEGTRLLHEVVAAFTVLDLERAAATVAGIRAHLLSKVALNLRQDPDQANALADVMAALEYFIEARRAASPDVEHRLAETERLLYRLRAFDRQAEELAQQEAEAAAPAPAAPLDAAPTPTPIIDEVDPEIRLVFLDEAAEVLEGLAALVPRWIRDSENRALATEIRRAFHTLKGSGRMVGAVGVSRFALAVESLLNRCLDGTVGVSGRVLDLVRDAVSMTEQLVDAFRQGDDSLPAEADALIQTAETLAAGDDEHETMLAVFRRDAEERLAVLRGWLAEIDRSLPQVAVAPEVLRAFHTLRGGGYAVNANAIGDLAGALETYLESLVAAGLRLDMEALSVIEACVGTLGDWAQRAGKAFESAPEAGPWLQKLDALQALVPQTAVDATSDRQLAEVFAAEAFDLVEQFEQGVRAWARSPDAGYHARELKVALHTLHGAALMSGCPPIAQVAFALHQRMDDFAEARSPAAGFFHRLLDIAEQLFRHLDAYREGERQGDASVGLMLVAALDVQESAAPPAGSRPDAAATEAAAVAPTATSAPTAPAVIAAAAPFSPPPTAAEPAAGALDSLPPDVDEELREIFLAEAAELLDAIEAQAQVLEREPHNGEAAQEMRRAFHTLKGSSRIAGFPEIGEVAYGMERIYDNAHRSACGVDLSMLADTRAVQTGLRRMVDDLSSGAAPSAAALSMGWSLSPNDAAAPGLVASDALILETPQIFELEEPAPAVGDPAETPILLDGGDFSSMFAPEADTLRRPEPSESAHTALDEPLMELGLQDSGAAEAAAPMAFGAEPAALHDDASLMPLEVAADEVFLLPEASLIEPIADESMEASIQGVSNIETLVLAEPEVDLPAGDADAGVPSSWAEPVPLDTPWPGALEAQLPFGASAEPDSRPGFDLDTSPPAGIDEHWAAAPQAPWPEGSPVSDFEAAESIFAEPLVVETPFLVADVAVDTGVAGEWSPPADSGGSISMEFAPAADAMSEPPGTGPAESAALEPSLSAPDAAEAAAAEPAVAGMVDDPWTAWAGGATEPEQRSLEAQFAVAREDVAAASQAPAEAQTAGVVGLGNVWLPAAPQADSGTVADLPAQWSLEPLDRELVEIFGAEAAELLEVLEASLSEWQIDAGAEGALREVQRALHTLKGGARMAGLDRFGTAVHEMESQVNAMEHGKLRRDAASFSMLASELEDLHHMHDQLSRGDFEGLTESPAMADETPLPVDPWVASMGEDAQPASIEPAPTATSSQVETEAAGPLLSLTDEGDLPPLIDDELPPERRPSGVWNPLLFWRPEEAVTGIGLGRRETARVPVERLDLMLNEAGEISIYRSRLEEQNIALQHALAEMSETVARMREQLRQMDLETEAQIAARGFVAGADKDLYESEFDPLEMDRYSRMQELSRALVESIGDLSALHLGMGQLTSGSETLLMQQGRVTTEVQTGLMGTLMVPFSRQVQRLQRVVRQTADDNGKMVDVVFKGVDSELDRNVLERMTAPLEHLLRNSVVHGIETPAERTAAGKEDIGVITVDLHREGSQLIIDLRDDGRGLNYAAIRETAIARGLLAAGTEVSDEDVARFIFAPGFSTASRLTQDAGRGIGMDVVVSEVRQLGGTLELGSEPGRGTRFLIRLPLMLAISQALLVGVGGEQYAVPLPAVDGITRVSREQLSTLLAGEALAYGDQKYAVHYLGEYLDLPYNPDSDARNFSVILVRAREGLGTQERHVGLIVDQLIGNREIVSKAAGPQISTVTGVSGATVLADGRVVLILDVQTLLQTRVRPEAEPGVTEVVEEATPDQGSLVMVVDDSVTMRRVAERLLLRNGYRVITARDGLEAMGLLQTESPAAMLLDIEMPRADGFEVAAFVRNTGRISRLPMIMITSRSGEKHRERARRLGVNRYLIKPYQEEQLLDELASVIRESVASDALAVT
jgi:chemosensory pili system protein ChpA (sensor histidine kinase/response regulator)